MKNGPSVWPLPIHLRANREGTESVVWGPTGLNVRIRMYVLGERLSNLCMVCHVGHAAERAKSRAREVSDGHEPAGRSASVSLARGKAEGTHEAPQLDN